LLPAGRRWGWAGARRSEWSPYGERCYGPPDPARGGSGGSVAPSA
jgi:hypothetical protein